MTNVSKFALNVCKRNKIFLPRSDQGQIPFQVDIVSV